MRSIFFFIYIIRLSGKFILNKKKIMGFSVQWHKIGKKKIKNQAVFIFKALDFLDSSGKNQTE